MTPPTCLCHVIGISWFLKNRTCAKIKLPEIIFGFDIMRNLVFPIMVLSPPLHVLDVYMLQHN